MIYKINDKYAFKKGHGDYILLQLYEGAYCELYYCEDMISLINHFARHAYAYDPVDDQEKVYKDVTFGIEKMQETLIPEYTSDSDKTFKKEATFAYNIISQENVPISMSDSIKQAVLTAFQNGGKVIPLVNGRAEVLYNSVDESTMYDEWLAKALEHLKGDK